MEDLPIENYKENKDNEKDLNNFSCWLTLRSNTFIPSKQTVSKLPPGKYTIKWVPDVNSYGFVKNTLNLDELLRLPIPTFNEIINDFDYFWNNKYLFDKYKFNYKRGILLYGNAGCGKSSILALVSQNVIDRGGIVISIQNENDLENYVSQVPSIFRIIEESTPLLVLFEDLDSLVSNSRNETMLLNILDGLEQGNNIINIGCTNYPEKLKERILNRPSRFDKRYYLGLPNSIVREFYFKNKIHLEDIEKMGGDSFIKDIVIKTEGLTLAHLGEFIKSVFIFNYTVEDTIKTLKEMGDFISSSKNEGNKKIGFNNERKE